MIQLIPYFVLSEHSAYFGDDLLPEKSTSLNLSIGLPVAFTPSTGRKMTDKDVTPIPAISAKLLPSVASNAFESCGLLCVHSAIAMIASFILPTV
ncbi:hypothetical protein GUD61_000493 [Salmonella enterica]|nr:hypothetical protein [Salmonella enterica]